MHVFERPCLPGWFYPCTVEDIRQRLSLLPESDLNGLWAVGLVPATRKDSSADGRYFFCEKPVVHLYAYPTTLAHKQPAHVRWGDIERGFAVELSYGMSVEQAGSRYLCVWKREDLHRFIVQHVLLHEIGHHVYHWQRRQRGYAYCPSTTESEQFAEAYARRWSAQG